MVDEIIYHLDSPSPEALVEAQRLNVQGWVACSPARRIAEVSIATRTGRQPLSLADRPDVVASVPHLNSTGFEGQVEPDGLAAPITIFFRFENGTLEQRSLSLRVSQESDEDFERRKAAKLARIAAILSCPHCKTSITTQATNPSIACACCGNSYRRERYALDFLTEELRARAKVFPVEAVSSNEYDPVTIEMISRHHDGLVLDNGSGLRSTYYSNVVNLDVVGYKTTDIIGIGESLPFRDASFDAVISIAVLEHVRNPFDAAREIERVLKPGGEIYIAVPFLQPFHGYPDHYYNMTSSGLRNLFPGLHEISMSVPLAGRPIWTVSWLLNSWAADLPAEERADFCSLKVADLMANPISQLHKRYVMALPEPANERLACVNVFRATKPHA